MMIVLKIVSLCCLLAICIQDFRERKLYIWILIGAGTLLSSTYFLETTPIQYLVNIGVNLSIIVLIVVILYGYAKLKLKTNLSNALGFGDILFFIIIAVSFPISTFIILFSFSLVFSLFVFLVAKPSLKNATVPLAGLQSIFLFLIFCINWIFSITNLYAL